MLKLDPRKIENFSDEDLVSLLEAGEWESILPQNLTDTQLLSLAGQLREKLGGTESKASYGQGRAAVALAMFLVANARGADFAGDCDFDLDRDMEVLRGVLVTLSMAYEREIVSRILDLSNDDESSSLFACVEVIVEKRGTSSS